MAKVTSHQPVVPRRHGSLARSESSLPAAVPAAHPILALQRSVGNQAVQRHLRAGPLTPHIIPGLQQTVGNQAVQRLLRAQASQAQPTAADTDPVGTPEATHEPEQQSSRTTALARLPQVRRTTGIVQRSSSGLAVGTTTAAFAGDAYTFWSDAANKDKPLQDLSDHLMTKVNGALPHSCKHAYSATSGESGAFNRAIWTITINTAFFSKRSGVSKVGDLTRAEVAEIVDTLYHESRHSEQYFRIAQVQAGEGKSAKEIETGMSIPADVATAAKAAPLTGDTKANKKLIEEARGWMEITIGKYATYKEETNDLILNKVIAMRTIFEDTSTDDSTKMTSLKPVVTATETSMTDFFAKEQAKIEKIKKKDSLDMAVLKHIKKMIAAFNKLKAEFDIQSGDATKVNIAKLNKRYTALWDANYAAYRDYEHEKDAWAVGAAAAKAFNKRAKKK